MIKEAQHKAKKAYEGLVFDEEPHKYYVHGNNFPSVSGFVGRFKHKFNVEKMSKLTAYKEKRTQKSVKKEWKELNDFGTSLGTDFHNFGEALGYLYLNDPYWDLRLKPETPQQEWLLYWWKHKKPWWLYPVFFELQMYSLKYSLCGTTDIVFIDLRTGKFIIADYKTNKTTSRAGKCGMFGSYDMMLAPFNDLKQNAYNGYQIQLSTYQILFQDAMPYEVSGRLLLWFKREGGFELYWTDDLTKKIYKEL